jgi:Schlafen, AlbA_2
MTPLEHEFEDAMLDIYEQAKRYNYYPNYFVRMVHEYHGVGAAKKLLAAENAQQGLFKLWEIKKLDLSMEALVAQDKYAPLFEAEEIEIARKRLKDLGYELAKGKSTSPQSDDRSLSDRIKAGESSTMEFKVAAAWNLRTNQRDGTMKENVLQAIASFMNSSRGGDIIIGVENDTGAIIGLARDYEAVDPKKKNRNGYELWLRNVIASALGADVTAFYETSIHRLEGKDIMLIHVDPAPKPIYLDGDFYIRDGNGKRKLKAVDAMSYIKQRWGF